MADFVFNIAKGRVVEKVADGAVLKMLVLRTANTDAANRDLTTVAALLAGGNTEANFTNYSRRTVTPTITVDNSTDVVRITASNITFTSAGGATNNTTTDVVIYEEVAGGDANCIPLVQLDAVFTTDGNDVTIQFNASGFFTAS